jgi:hypothetical protein
MPYANTAEALMIAREMPPTTEADALPAGFTGVRIIIVIGDPDINPK